MPIRCRRGATCMRIVSVARGSRRAIGRDLQAAIAKNACRRLCATASAGWRRSSRRRKHAGAPGKAHLRLSPEVIALIERPSSPGVLRELGTRRKLAFTVAAGVAGGGPGAGTSCPRQARRPGGPAASRRERDCDYGAVHRAACMRRGHLWERRRPLGASRPALHGHGAASGSRAAVTRPEKCVTVDRSAARAMARESV